MHAYTHTRNSNVLLVFRSNILFNGTGAFNQRKAGTMYQVVYGMLFMFFVVYTYSAIKKWRGKIRRCTLHVMAEVYKESVVPKEERGIFRPVFRACDDNTMIDSAVYPSVYKILFRFKEKERIYIWVNPSDRQDFMFGNPYRRREMFMDLLRCLSPFLLMLIFYLHTL